MKRYKRRQEVEEPRGGLLRRLISDAVKRFYFTSELTRVMYTAAFLYGMVWINSRTHAVGGTRRRRVASA
jgi:hypothetical protein